MNWREILKAMIAAQKDLLDKAKTDGRVFTDEEKTKWDECQKKINDAQAMINFENGLAASVAFGSAPATIINSNPINHKPKLFKSLGEQLTAIVNAGVNASNTDARLLEINNSATGANSGVGSDGGFALQEDFAGNMFDSAYKASDILSACQTVEVGPNADSLAWNELDDTDISTVVYGGVQAYWAAEAGTVESSKPKIYKNKLELEKIMGIGYMTDELARDSVAMGSLFGEAFPVAITRTAEASIFSGDGIGKCTGILNGASTISVAKVADQAADTLIHKNIVSMWLRMDSKKRNGAKWYIHPDLEEQLEMMIFTGSAAAPVPIYLPSNGLSNTGYATLKGCPVILNDNCSAIGDKGDILLANMKDYLIIRKGDITQDQSIHVRFVFGENCFRFTYRLNGKPKRKAPTTIKNSAITRASFVTLDAR